jgi:hypothetical protein
MHIVDIFGKKTLTFPKLQRYCHIVCECHRTNATGETKMKLQTGSDPDLRRCVPMSPYMAVNVPGTSLHFVVSPRCLQHCDVFVGISLED